VPEPKYSVLQLSENPSLVRTIDDEHFERQWEIAQKVSTKYMNLCLAFSEESVRRKEKAAAEKKREE
jgi:hypothetical protein